MVEMAYFMNSYERRHTPVPVTKLRRPVESASQSTAIPSVAHGTTFAVPMPPLNRIPKRFTPASSQGDSSQQNYQNEHMHYIRRKKREAAVHRQRAARR